MGIEIEERQLDEEIAPREVALPSELEIESGALIPTFYKEPRGALRKSTSVCIDVSEEANLFADLEGNIKRETPRAKKAFEDYINLGVTRTLEKLARIYCDESNEDWTNNFESVLRQLKGYSSTFDWQNRLRILLTQEAANAISAARSEQAKSARGRIQLAKKLQGVGNQLIDKASEYLAMNVDMMSDKDANTLLKTAVTMLDVGLASERVEIGAAIENILPPKPISAMDDEELAEFIKVLTHQL